MGEQVLNGSNNIESESEDESIASIDWDSNALEPNNVLELDNALESPIEIDSLDSPVFPQGQGPLAFALNGSLNSPVFPQGRGPLAFPSNASNASNTSNASIASTPASARALEAVNVAIHAVEMVLDDQKKVREELEGSQ
ncbi:hypothetical protein P7C73_g428, partial [Tremellales sp. Uapishka_1]